MSIFIFRKNLSWKTVKPMLQVFTTFLVNTFVTRKYKKKYSLPDSSDHFVAVTLKLTAITFLFIYVVNWCLQINIKTAKHLLIGDLHP